MTPGYAWSWLSVPYLAAAGVLLAVVASAVVLRGDRVIRVGLIGATGTLLPWTLTSALAACADRETALRLHQLGNGPTMLFGPCLLLILLAVNGQLDRYRRMTRWAVASGILLMALSWSTSWFLVSVRRIPSGIWFPAAGPLLWLHALQILGWPVAGVATALRSLPSRQRAQVMRYFTALPALALVATADTLLAYGVTGVYPFAWAPALAGGVVCLHLIYRTDVLRMRGFDRALGVEAIGYTVASVAIAAVAWALRAQASEPVVVALLTAPLWGAGLLVAWMQQPGGVAAVAAHDQVLAEGAREIGAGVTGTAIERLSALWHDRAGLTKVRLEVHVDKWSEDVRTWLRSLRAPVMSAEVATMRLGRKRPAVEQMFMASGAAVVVPVFDRGEPIAVVEAGQRVARSLRDAERLFLYDSAQLVGRALTYEALLRDADAAAASAREVELANVLSAQVRPLLDDELGSWRLAVQHRPAPRSGGQGWSWARLDDGRMAVMIAEADSQGVSGALVIAALQGAFAARSRAPGCGAAELLAALRDTVAEIGRRCLVLVLDAGAQTLCWASHGHDGAALISEQGVTSLRGLGGGVGGELPLPPGSLILLMSSSVAAAVDRGAALADATSVHGRGLRLVARLVELAGEAGRGAAGEPGAPHQDLLAIGLVQASAGERQPASVGESSRSP